MLLEKIEILMAQARTHLMMARELKKANQDSWLHHVKEGRRCTEMAILFERKYNQMGLTTCIKNPLAA